MLTILLFGSIFKLDKEMVIMLKKVEAKQMGTGSHTGLESKFHFSFDQYYNPDNMNFGVLRVLNDDLVEPHSGFDMHPHRNMEIISYVIDGKLTHGDNMGNKRTLERGHVQYMSAGTGVFHSEHNLENEMLRFLQIWILPDKNGHHPNYGDYRFNWEERENKFLHIVSSKEGSANIKINQDINVYVLALDEGKSIDFEVSEDRMAYLVQIEGSSVISDIVLEEQDALEIVGESISIKASSTSHFIVLEMNQ